MMTEEDQKGLLRSSESVTRESKSWMHSKKNSNNESMDFDEMESIMWSKHQLRRFFQDRGNWWTSSRRTTLWNWVLVILTGVLIALMGVLIEVSTQELVGWKFSTMENFMASGNQSKAFFAFMATCMAYSIIAGSLCWFEPFAAGSGIPEIKAFLNGVNLKRVVRIKVLYTKVLGMIFSVSSGLPLGKEGPMIHTGSILGAAVSQGKTFTFGIDTSWTKFQDLRNDRSKRDFVTYGAAAGVAAAFEAPIGGILFTLEEGASFWSTSLTFKSFFCAMMTQLTISLVNDMISSGASSGSETVQVGIQFGEFSNTSYYTYELILFIIMGVFGGVMGAIFNSINERVTRFRQKNYDQKWKKMLELLLFTGFFSIVCFSFPLMVSGTCTPLPTQTATWPTSEYALLNKLPQFNCASGQYNQLASLFLVSSDQAMQSLFHLSELNNVTYVTFSSGPLIVFFLAYFFMAAITAGTFCPAGLFVPTLMAGAAYGRLIGHIMNLAFPGKVSDSGIYALMGAASILGGMSRMTIAGAVILLEASGTTAFLLPLMLTFAAARYAGNAINEPMYDMQMNLKELPFLEGDIKTLGLLNYHPVVEIMAAPVVTVNEICRVSAVKMVLEDTKHNGFPVIGKDGHLKGLILRKVLCSLLHHKVFSVPVSTPPGPNSDNNTQLTVEGELFHDTMERNYPRYPEIVEINLSETNKNAWLDLRPYMDTSPYSINESASVQRAYRFFRTMGLRHLLVVNGNHRVVGMITRQDLTEHRLEHHWFHEADNMQKFLHVGALDPAVVNGSDEGGIMISGQGMLHPMRSSTTTPTLVPRQGSSLALHESSVGGAFVGTYAAPNIRSSDPATGSGDTGPFKEASLSLDISRQSEGATVTAGAAAGAAAVSPTAPAAASSRTSRAMKEPKSLRANV